LTAILKSFFKAVCLDKIMPKYTRQRFKCLCLNIPGTEGQFRDDENEALSPGEGGGSLGPGRLQSGSRQRE